MVLQKCEFSQVCSGRRAATILSKPPRQRFVYDGVGHATLYRDLSIVSAVGPHHTTVLLLSVVSRTSSSLLVVDEQVES